MINTKKTETISEFCPTAELVQLKLLTLPRTSTWPSWFRAADVVEGRMTVAGAQEQAPQQVEASVRRRRGEQARRREASTSTPSPPSPGKRSRGQKVAEDGNLCC